MVCIFKEPAALQYFAAVKIVAELYNQLDINAEIIPFNFPKSFQFDVDDEKLKAIKNQLKNQMIENNMMEQVSALPIPEPLKNSLMKTVNKLGLEIRKWWFYHKVENKDLVLRMPNKFCWTSHGTVDNKKTAEFIVADDSVEIETRYAIACTYCLVNEIRILWKRIPEKRQERFYSFEDNCPNRPWEPLDPRNSFKKLVVFWTYTINDKVNELQKLIRNRYGLYISSDLFAFKWATFGLNRAATEFFFNKLSCIEKNRHLVDCTFQVLHPNFFHSCKLETTFFLLNQMSEEQRDKVFKRRVFDILESLLNWPYSPFFVKTAKKYFHYLLQNEHRYSNLFNAICDKIKRDEKGYYYKELFLQFWEIASVNDPNCFRKNYILLKLIRLYEAKEEDLLKSILQQASALEKEQLLYIRANDSDHLSLLIKQDRWTFLKFLMDQCVTCKEIIINFRKNIASQHSREENATSKVKLSQALLLVDDFISK